MAAQDYYEPLQIIERIKKNTAFGYDMEYIVTDKYINGAVGTTSKKETLIAESRGIKAKYVITIDQTDSLPLDTLVKRQNGQYLVITSDERDDNPPTISTFDWWQRYADAFIMP